MKETDSKYHVGDTVRVVDTFLDIDQFNEERDEYNGKSATIRLVKWCNTCGRYEYRVKECDLIWVDNNFEFDIQNELPDFDVSEVDLRELFS